MFKGDKYLLCGPLGENGDLQYWSDANGWVERENATLFSLEETQEFKMPSGSFGWIKYQDLGYKHDF
jgi:hypothetical protein